MIYNRCRMRTSGIFYPITLNMKKIICIYAALIGLSFTSLAQAQKPTGQQVQIIENGLRFCESTYPYEGGILIANFGTQELNPLNTEGKGYILHYNKEGKLQPFITADGNLSAPKGMFIRESHLFVCDVNKIVVYDLNRLEAAPQILSFPEGHLFVNDLAAIGNTLYASVTNTDKIFSIDISDVRKAGQPVEWLTIPGPNGLLADNNQLYVASYPADGNTQDKHTIYRVTNLAQPQSEKVIEIPGQYDGIAFSTDKASLYITNWSPAGLSKIDLKTGKTVPVSIQLDKALMGPADITVANHRIYIPDLPNSRVMMVKEQ